MHTALGELLASTARRFGTKPALVSAERTLTFAELDRLSTRFAAGLAALGIRPGDRVTLWLENGWRWAVSYYGILRLGAVVNPANSLLTEFEILHMTEDCGAKAIVAHASKLSHCRALRLRTITDSEVPETPGRAFDDVIDEGAGALHRWMPPPIETGSICSIFYTSGTTGFPKGAALRHQSVIVNVAMTCLMHGMHAEDTVVSALPCAHVYGNVVLNSAVACGMTLVLLPRLEELELLEAIERYRATVLHGVPSMYLALLNIADLERFDLESLRLCAVGGQSMAVPKMKELESRIGCPLIELWGMTEIAGLGATHPYNGPSNLGSIGIPLPFTQIKIADPKDADREVPGGDIGELLVRGPHVMQGYFNRPHETAETIGPDGWLHSGDLATRDERGYLYIVDRLKDVILSGGYTVYPAEVERIVAQVPQVCAAMVVPVADELRGQIAKALVVLRPGATCATEDIVRYCRERLAGYKVPRAIEFVSSLPTGATGKVVRRTVTPSVTRQ
jgi:long-chain acyl-CoA synthetase